MRIFFSFFFFLCFCFCSDLYICISIFLDFCLVVAVTAHSRHVLVQTIFLSLTFVRKHDRKNFYKRRRTQLRQRFHNECVLRCVAVTVNKCLMHQRHEKGNIKRTISCQCYFPKYFLNLILKHDTVPTNSSADDIMSFAIKL